MSKCSHLHSLGKNAEEKINEVREEYREMFNEYQQAMEKKYSVEVGSIRSLVLVKNVSTSVKIISFSLIIYL